MASYLARIVVSVALQKKTNVEEKTSHRPEQHIVVQHLELPMHRTIRSFDNKKVAKFIQFFLLHMSSSVCSGSLLWYTHVNKRCIYIGNVKYFNRNGKSFADVSDSLTHDLEY